MADTRRSRSSFSRPSITDVSVASADRLKPAARILVTALVDVLPQEKLSGAEVHALVEAIQEADPSGAALYAASIVAAANARCVCVHGRRSVRADWEATTAPQSS